MDVGLLTLWIKAMEVLLSWAGKVPFTSRTIHSGKLLGQTSARIFLKKMLGLVHLVEEIYQNSFGTKQF